jgi:hypothetical protein
MKLWFTNYIGILCTGLILLLINSIGFTLWVTHLWTSLKSAFVKATGGIALDLFKLLLTQGFSSDGLWQLVVNQKTLFEPFIWPLIYLLLGLALLNLLIISFHMAGIYSLTNQFVCKQKARILSYFKKGFSKFFPVFILFLLIGILSLPFLAIAVWIDYSLLQSITNNFTLQGNWIMWLLGILLALFILFICVVILMQLTIFAPAAMFAEDIGPFRALIRSFRHVFLSFKRVSLTVLQLLFLFLITGAFIFVLNSPGLFAFFEPFLVGSLANLWNILINILVLPVIYAGTSSIAILLLLQRYHRYLNPHSSSTEKEDTDQSTEKPFTFSLENHQSSDT